MSVVIAIVIIVGSIIILVFQTAWSKVLVLRAEAVRLQPLLLPPCGISHPSHLPPGSRLGLFSLLQVCITGLLKAFLGAARRRREKW